MKKIISKILDNKKSVILATIVNHAGSVPRQTGAQMVVDETGLIAGTIGGGRPEYDAINKAKELLKECKSGKGSYNSTAEFNQPDGMICGGNIDVWFAYIEAADIDAKAVLKQALDLMEQRIAFDFNQVYNSEVDRIYFNLEKDIATQNGNQSEDSTSSFEAIDKADASEEIFVLPWKPTPRAIVFGGGHVAQALIPILSSVDFECIIIDDRQEMIAVSLKQYGNNEAYRTSIDAVGMSDEVNNIKTSSNITAILGDYNDIDKFVYIEEGDFVIIMTNGHLGDYAVLRQVLRKKCAYVGLMGSRKKIATINERLKADDIADEAIARVHTPIGLNIGAVTPAEIAVSVAAECISVRRQKGGAK